MHESVLDRYSCGIALISKRRTSASSALAEHMHASIKASMTFLTSLVFIVSLFRDRDALAGLRRAQSDIVEKCRFPAFYAAGFVAFAHTYLYYMS